MAREAVWVLEWMGYHSVNEKYLRAFLRAQGTVVAPGKAYAPHPGYLAAPRFVRAVDWLTDHGALLYDICSHALLTGDAEFIQNHTDAVVKACDFLKDARSLRHDGIQGILPAARADDSTVAQAIWTNAWNYKGLVTAVRLLRRINHPRAEEFAREAEAYREAIEWALRVRRATVDEALLDVKQELSQFSADVIHKIEKLGPEITTKLDDALASLKPGDHPVVQIKFEITLPNADQFSQALKKAQSVIARRRSSN